MKINQLLISPPVSGTDVAKQGFGLHRILCLAALVVNLFAVGGVWADVEINDTNFPDRNFRYYVKEYCQPDGDNLLTDDEIAWVTEINAVEMGISNLKGVEYLTELKYLDVSFNNLGQLDLSQNTKLVRLDCGSNQLTSLDLSNNTELRMLFCTNNQLTSLDVTNNTKLRYLYCSGNQIGNAEMGKLVASMPTYRPESQENPSIGTFKVFDNSVDDQNIITAAQVNAAKAKNWQVVAYFTNGGEQDYEGFIGYTINDTNFPDATFRSYVSSKCDTNRDGILGIEEIEAVTKIDISWVFYQNLTDLTGVQYFTELTSLNCHKLNLTTLDVSKNKKLTKLDCGYNTLTSLNVSGCTALTELDCSSNQLTSLDVSDCTALTILNCDINKLTALSVSNNTALTTLNCQQNQLTVLDVTNNTALTSLDVSYNKLNALDVSHNTVLTFLYCSHNQLTTLDVSNNKALTSLNCGHNDGVTTLNCSNLQLTDLDVSGCEALTTLDCSGNQLDGIGTSGWGLSSCQAINKLYCYNNQMWGENLSNLVESLPTTGGELYVYGDENTEGNEMTTVQVYAANAKGWQVLSKDGSPYNGMDPGLAIDKTNFPDDIFCNYVKNNCDLDKDGYLTEKEIQSVTSISVSSEGIADLKGIEYFTALTYLVCQNNNLVSLNLSGLASLNHFKCNNNQLESLNLSGCKALSYMECQNNNLKSLNLWDLTSLSYFTCHNNQLVELDVSNCTKLNYFVCNNNQLVALYMSSEQALGNFVCYGNKIRNRGMDYFISSLPTNSSNQNLNICRDEAADGNEMNTRQVAAAIAKNWIPKIWDGSKWVDYPGVPYYVAINEEYFPDKNFRDWLLAQPMGADGKLTEEELAATELDVSGQGIESLSGIEYFTALTKLVCSNNKIENLWLSRNPASTELWIDNNQIWGYAMNTLIQNLSDNGGVIRVFSNSATEGNGMTSTQVRKAKDKGWTVLTSDGAEYAGIDPGIAIDERHFYDQTFRYMVRRGADSDGDEYLNEVELRNWTSFGDVLVNRQIKSLQGIEYFTSLNELKCWINNIDGSFVSLLPVTTDGKLYYFYGEGRDFNTMTPAQVYTANQKGWRVLREDGSDYLGVIVEGDADGNGEVGTQDVERLSDYILGRNSSAFSLKSADLDDNGTADITDLTLLIEKLKKVRR